MRKLPKGQTEDSKLSSAFDLSKYKKSKFANVVKFKEQKWIPLSEAFQEVTSIPGIPVGHITLLRGHSDTGKAQPLYSKIYTPDGFKFMGDIKEGDLVMGSDGSPKKVLGVYPQGMKDLYKINFSDGFSVECCGEHLWKVKTIKNQISERDYKKRGNNEDKLDQWETYTTKQLIENKVWIEYGKTKPHKVPNYTMPICEPVQFSKKELFLDPYLLGVLLGYGGITYEMKSTSVDDFIINKTSNNFNTTGIQDNTNPLLDWTETNKLNVAPELKFIPKEYLYSSVKDRINLLKGLMDTRGALDKNGGNIHYSTTSKQLAYDVSELVQSLGCVASISFVGNKVKGYYKILINQNNLFDVFSSPRKQDLVKSKTKYKTSRTIHSIEHLGKTEQQCIYIDSSDHLYLTDNFTVTHNTTALIECAIQCQKMGILPVFLTTEMKFNWDHVREMGLNIKPVVNEDGEIVDYEGFFIYIDAGQLEIIEDVAAAIVDLLDEQKRGDLPYDLCFLWDSIGSIQCRMSRDSKSNRNEWNAGAMSTQFSNNINQKIPLSRKEGMPYTNTLVCVNKVWVDSLSGGPMSKPRMMNKGGQAMWYDSTLIIDFGNVSNPGTSKIKAQRNKKSVEFAKRTKIALSKNHINGVTSTGTIIMTSHGFIDDTDKAINAYKKEHSHKWLQILGEDSFDIIVEDEFKEDEIAGDTEE